MDCTGAVQKSVGCVYLVRDQGEIDYPPCKNKWRKKPNQTHVNKEVNMKLEKSHQLMNLMPRPKLRQEQPL